MEKTDSFQHNVEGTLEFCLQTWNLCKDIWWLYF